MRRNYFNLNVSRAFFDNLSDAYHSLSFTETDSAIV